MSAGLATAFAKSEGPTAVRFLVVVLLHEAGHAAAMAQFGYRAITVVVIPSRGGFTTGLRPRATMWEQAIVALAGPLPGALLGVALLAMAAGEPGALEDWGMAFFLLNVSNAVPLESLDGAHLLEALAGPGSRDQARVASVAGVALLLGLAVVTGSYWILILPAAMFFTAARDGFPGAAARRVARAAAAAGVRDPDDDALPGLAQRILYENPRLEADEAAGLLQRVRDHLARPMTPAQRALIGALWLSPVLAYAVVRLGWG